MRRAVILFVVLMTSYAYFYEGGGWNQNTRFDLVRAIVERHEVRIDAYHENTGDKAQVGDHYYTDKAPGASLTAVPAVALVRGLMWVAGIDVASAPAVTALSYVATVMAAGFPAAVAALCVFFLCLRFGFSDNAAGIAVLVCGLGTPLWPYATLLYGHTLACGCLMTALLAAVHQQSATSSARQNTLAFVTGLAAGWAVVAEFPAIVPGAIITLFGVLPTLRSDPRRTFRIALAAAAGLTLAASVLLSYNWLAFGDPFHVSYSSEAGDFEGMKSGIFGVSWPRLSVAREVLLGAYRGLLPLAPVLVLVPVGFWFLVRDRSSRAAGTVAASVIVFYVLLNLGYAYWEGGWSYGPRHLGPALAFMALGIAPVWQRGRAVVRALILVLAMVGAGQALIAVTTTPQPPNGVQRPMQELLWPAFREAEFPLGWQSVLELRPPEGSLSELVSNGVPRASWNLGQLAGLEGHASLLPLFLVWALGVIAWVRTHAGAPLRQNR